MFQNPFFPAAGQAQASFCFAIMLQQLIILWIFHLFGAATVDFWWKLVLCLAGERCPNPAHFCCPSCCCWRCIRWRGTGTWPKKLIHKNAATCCPPEAGKEWWEKKSVSQTDRPVVDRENLKRCFTALGHLGCSSSLLISNCSSI